MMIPARKRGSEVLLQVGHCRSMGQRNPLLVWKKALLSEWEDIPLPSRCQENGTGKKQEKCWLAESWRS